MKRVRLISVAAMLVAAASAQAMYLRLDVKNIPLARLTRNLRQALQADSLNATTISNLARAYAMAWSLKSDSVPAVVSTWYDLRGNSDSVPIEPKEVFFGDEYDVVPYTRTTETKLPERQRVAQAHFDTAMSLYDRLLKLKPNDQMARLGRAWLLTHTSRRNLAISELRAVARPNDKVDQADGIRAEAGRYLAPLLNPKRDKEEIAKLANINRVYDSRMRVVTPIAIPLRSGLDATDIENRSARITFDADGSALPKQWTWINPNAGWLVHDPTGSGRVTSALQMFGSVTFWMFWSNGYDALCSLDDNGDGRIAARELKGLALWVDKNQNGKSERGEVRTLEQHGIVSLSCAHTRDASHRDRIMYSPQGVQFRDGTTRPTFDLLLHVAPSRVIAAKR